MRTALKAVAVGVALAGGAAGAQGLPYRSETCETSGRVCLIVEQSDTETASVSVRTTARTELTVTLRMERENAEPSVPLPLTTVISGPGTHTLVKLKRGRRELGWRYWDIRYTWNWGDFRSVHADSVRYRLPFAMSQPVRIIQGNDGTFSHHGAWRYAVDFDLPEGTPVHVAREGVVAEVVQTFTTAGTDASYREQDKGNRVMVRHADGTLAYYGHLQAGGVVVTEGQSVAAGQLLGRSGNTGYSVGPHLHFDVRAPTRDGPPQTVPVRFTTEQGLGIVLEQDRFYTPTR